MIGFKVKKIISVFLIILISIQTGCKSNNEEKLVITFDFKDSKYNKKNFEFDYIIVDKDLIVLEKGPIKLNLFSKMHIPKPDNATGVIAVISVASNASGVNLYSDLRIQHEIPENNEVTFFVVDPTEYKIESINSNDLRISIINKKRNEYNFIGIFNKEGLKVVEYIVNSNIENILLSELLTASDYIKEKGFNTDFALKLFGDVESLEYNEVYELSVQSGKVNSYGTLMTYSQYESEGIIFTFMNRIHG